MDNTSAALLLHSISDIGGRRFKELLDIFKKPSELFRLSSSELKEKSVPEIIIYKISKAKITDEIKRTIDCCAERNYKIIFYGSDEYPENLAELYSPPSILYTSGDLLPADKNSLAIVGSRFASKYGLQITEQFTKELIAFGITIVSGFAKGIDITAHTAAIEANGRTLCVLGSGLNRNCIYPAEHKIFYDRMLQGKNAVFISEYPPDTIASKQNFPARNRIVSGLSLGTLIVQAGKQSGALITAKMALEQNREVFAIPDRIGLPHSCGTNDLIKRSEAKLVQCVDDILDEILTDKNLLKPGEKTKYLQKQCELTGLEKKMLDILTDTPQKLSEIAYLLDITEPNANVILMKLEIKNLVCQLPGRLFFKII